MSYRPDASSRTWQPRVLSENDIDRIHHLSLDILEKVGLRIDYPPARALLRGHGAVVDESHATVRMTRRLVEQALQAAPRAITMHSMDTPAHDCLLGMAGGLYARPASGLNWILDAGTATRREVAEQDAVNWTRVAHALPNIHFAAAAYDQGGAPESMEVRATARMLRYTNKPVMVSGVSGEGMRWVHRLTEAVQPVGRQPRAMMLSSVNSPLHYSHGQLEAAMVSGELGIPVLFNSSAVAGATAPVTLAGDLVQMNAEMLAALTILQLHRPGAAAVYTGHPVIMDMRSGISAFGFAEIGLLAAACVELGRFYGLPTASDGLTADSCSPDAMAASEKWASGYLPLMAGANINGGAGALASQSTISLEQMVIDDEIYGNMLRQARGIQVDDETLAGELIASLGPGGSFLPQEHTFRHYRDEVWYSALGTRLSAPSWEAGGSKDVLERTKDRVRQILAGQPDAVLADGQAQDLLGLVAAAEQSLA
jgi:trimethylamine---corrinoid protein Co-methyltransferase